MYTRQSAKLDRNKRHLKRTTFEDIPNLSTIYENEEDHSRSSPNHRSNRAFSPLPELIIEVEPKVNKHDEPPEYYERLERLIISIYRREVLGIDEGNISPDYNIRGMFEDTNHHEISSRQETIASGESDITSQSNNDGLPETARENTDTEDISRDNDEEFENVQESAEHQAFAEVADAGTISGSCSTKTEDQQSPEIMRQYISDPIDISIPTRFGPAAGVDIQDDILYSGKDLPTENLEELDKSLVMEPDVEDLLAKSGDNVSTLSTPPMSPILPSPSKAKKRKLEVAPLPRRRSIYSFASSQDSVMGVKEFCTQTNFSTDSSCTETPFGKLFKGTPTIFNLCTCEGHQCS